MRVGELLRDWRQRRRLSQLQLATQAEVSPRHLSFVETGRSRPSPELILHLAEHLDVPLRERNTLLLAAGYAPTFRETSLGAPELETVRGALDQVLVGYEPYPAVVVDRRWDVVAMNGAVGILLEGVNPALLAPPVNVLRLALDPKGMAPRILNLEEWRAHLLDRLRRQVLLTGDEVMSGLFDELAGGGGTGARTWAAPSLAESPPALAVPLRLQGRDGVLSFISTVTTFGTALDVTLAELALEAFLPADAATASALTKTST